MDLHALATLIPPREHWRLYPRFVDRAVFFDIECDSADDPRPTVVTAMDRDGLHAFIEGRNLDDLPELLARSPLWVTFNGTVFDVPVLRTHFGAALTQLDAPPVKALVVYNSNPAAIAPDQSTVLRGMRRDDLFTVVLEQFQTDTADHADIVLPVTTFLEHTDVYLAYGHYYLQLAHAAVPPPGECRCISPSASEDSATLMRLWHSVPLNVASTSSPNLT